MLGWRSIELLRSPVRMSEVEWREWSTLEEVQKCGWVREHYPWVRMDMTRSGCDNMVRDSYTGSGSDLWLISGIQMTLEVWTRTEEDETQIATHTMTDDIADVQMCKWKGAWKCGFPYKALVEIYYMFSCQYLFVMMNDADLGKSQQMLFAT